MEYETKTAAGIPRTGQTTSYADGDDGDVRAGIQWPIPRFTKNGDGTVTDNLTGLVWLEDWSCLGEKNWADALTATNTLSQANPQECGLIDGSVAGDWRLPNRKELQSLTDLQFANPAVPNTAGTAQWTTNGEPFKNVQSAFYWSSTTLAGDSTGAWVMGFEFGNVFFFNKTSLRQVLAVSGGGL